MIRKDDNNVIVETLNGQIASISNVMTNSFQIDIDTSDLTPYVSGGAVRKMITTIGGLDHLEGETVAVLVDGATHPDVVVDGGEITLNTEGATVQIGYNFQSDFQLLRIDAGSQNGTSIGKNRRIS